MEKVWVLGRLDTAVRKLCYCEVHERHFALKGQTQKSIKCQDRRTIHRIIKARIVAFRFLKRQLLVPLEILLAQLHMSRNLNWKLVLEQLLETKNETVNLNLPQVQR